jgi:hypothetical protein
MYKLAILMILVSAACFGQVAEPSRPMIQFPDGTLLSPENPMPVTATVNVASVTVEVFPVYADEAGDPHTAEVDPDSRVKINLQAEGIGLLDAIDNAKAAIENLGATATQILAATKDIPLSPMETVVTKFTLAPNVAQIIQDLWIASPNQRQKYVEIKTQDPEKEFWINFGTPAAVGTGRPCIGRAYIDQRIQSVYVVASEAIDVYVTRAAIQVNP